MKVSGIGIWLILLTFFFSCGSSPESPLKEPLRTATATDVPEEKIPIKIGRFENSLFSIRKETFTDDTSTLYRTYGSFPDLFFNNVIRIGTKKLPLFRENILGFTGDPEIKSVFKDVNSKFADLSKEEDDFSIAFSRFKLLFPDTVIPDLLTIISGFNYNIVVSDSALAIGLDMYLGDSCRFYEWLGIPEYKKVKMNRSFLVADAIRGFLSASFVNVHSENDLISSMLYEGKIIYLSQALLPHIKTNLLMGYTEPMLEWCEQNESKIWSHFIDKKLFYSTDFNDEVAYINDAPFTKGFPKESPGRTGVWLGFKIIQSYMNNHKEITIQELMYHTDAHGIFNRSGYKPGRK